MTLRGGAQYEAKLHELSGYKDEIIDLTGFGNNEDPSEQRLGRPLDDLDSVEGRQRGDTGVFNPLDEPANARLITLEHVDNPLTEEKGVLGQKLIEILTGSSGLINITLGGNGKQLSTGKIRKTPPGAMIFNYFYVTPAYPALSPRIDIGFMIGDEEKQKPDIISEDQLPASFLSKIEVTIDPAQVLLWISAEPDSGQSNLFVKFTGDNQYDASSDRDSTTLMLSIPKITGADEVHKLLVSTDDHKEAIEELLATIDPSGGLLEHVGGIEENVYLELRGRE